jgi:hypothetical protein
VLCYLIVVGILLSSRNKAIEKKKIHDSIIVVEVVLRCVVFCFILLVCCGVSCRLGRCAVVVMRLWCVVSWLRLCCV